jgi:putative flippase GtrA
MKPELKPTNKVAASGLTGAIVVILMWVLSLLGADVPAAVAVAISTVVSVVVGWLVPNGS